MIRFLAIAAVLASLSCGTATGPLGLRENLKEVGAHCQEVCVTKDAFVVGYLSIRPFDAVKCICKRVEEEKPGFEF